MGSATTSELIQLIDPPGAPVVPPLLVETVDTTRLGHVFVRSDGQHPNRKSVVIDFVMEQTGASGCDAHMTPILNARLNAPAGYFLNVRAGTVTRPRRFAVTPPPSTTVTMSAYFGRIQVNPTGGDVFDPYPMEVYFRGTSGSLPSPTYKYFGITHATNMAVVCNYTAELSAPFTFGSVAIGGHYPTRRKRPVSANYEPLSYAAPIGLPTGDAIPFVMFSYETDATVDPGPFVKLR